MAYEIVPCLYNTEKDLQARLSGTICRYDNKPVYVSVRSAKELELFDPKTVVGYGEGKRIKIIDPTDELFDISSPEIGYFNYDFDKEVPDKKRYSDPSRLTGNLVMFMQRSPVKQWKQGLYNESIRYWGINGQSIAPPVQFHTMFYSHGVEEMICMEYPTIPAAVYKLMRMNETDRFKQIAVSKDVALEKTDSGIVQVFLKKVNVGYILPGERTIHIKKEKNSWIIQKYIEGLRASVE